MSGGFSKRSVAGRAGCRVRGMRTTCKERPQTAGRGRPWQPCGRDVSASRHLRLGTWPWFGCMRGAQGQPGRCCVWSARPSRPSGAAPVPCRRSFSDFWLENDFLFWPVYGSYYLTPLFTSRKRKKPTSHEIKPPLQTKRKHFTNASCHLCGPENLKPCSGARKSTFRKRTMARVRGDQGVVNWRKPGKTGFWRPNVVSRSTYARIWGAGCALGGQNRLF
jgi:hypothetical protein